MATEPTTYPAVYPEDLTELLKLLQEYTDKVRRFCEAEEQIRTVRSCRRAVLLLIAGVSFFGVGYYLLNGLPVDANAGDQILWPLSCIVSALSTLLLLLDFALLTKNKILHEITGEELYRILTDLTKAASQYFEHSKKRVGENFEFTVRLSEAEAVLNLYKKLKTSSWPKILTEPFQVMLR